MPRVRMEFSKGDQVRFLSHLDMIKAFERAIRRAEIPIAFSEGFNPHPRMNFASAVAVGVTSEREYVDIELRPGADTNDIVERLAQALPPGICVKRGQPVPDSTPALMAEVNRAVYKVIAAPKGPIDSGLLETKLNDFMNRPEVVVTKRTKKGPRQKDIRPGIVGLQGTTENSTVDFSIITFTGSEGNIRPEEVVYAFTEWSGLPLDGDSLYIRRIALYIEKDGKLVSPMDIHMPLC